jgi:hypothetical protein
MAASFYARAMRLEAANGNSLELSIVGYEFPAIDDDEWDSNWLEIKVSASSDRGSWTTIAPCLLTTEVATLADWLEALARQETEVREFDFIEPSVSFELVDNSDAVRLRAWFELEFRPRWAPWKKVPERDLCVDLTVTRDDLRAAAESLRTQLRGFPPRAGR